MRHIESYEVKNQEMNEGFGTNETAVIKELKADLAKLSTEIPKTYVTRDDYRQDLKEIRDLLAKIFDKLDGKVDR